MYIQKQPNAIAQAQEFNTTVVSTELINFYGMTSSEVQNFVGIIDNQGIPLLTVRLNAMNEFRSGTSSGISKAKEVIQTANSRGIEVCVAAPATVVSTSRMLGTFLALFPG